MYLLADFSTGQPRGKKDSKPNMASSFIRIPPQNHHQVQQEVKTRESARGTASPTVFPAPRLSIPRCQLTFINPKFDFQKFNFMMIQTVRKGENRCSFVIQPSWETKRFPWNLSIKEPSQVWEWAERSPWSVNKTCCHYGVNELKKV